MTKGRYREFFQCDFDIAGEYEAMLPDAECVKIIDEVLSELDIGDYEIKVNHRLLLEGMFALSGIEDKDFKVVCSSVDKLDKHSWSEVKNELINEKLIPENAVEKLKNFAMLREQNPAMTNSQLLELFQQISSVDGKLLGTTPKRISFDPSLARGLDYYTGTIYEAVVKDVPAPLIDALSLGAGKGGVVADPFSATEVPKGDGGCDQTAASGPIGSVAAGGRYDKLVGMFLKANQTDSTDASDNKKKKKSKDVDIPCVWVSFGIERLFTIMELKARAVQERMKLCSFLWSAGIRCEFSYKANAKWLVDIQHCEKNNIPIACILGKSEVEKKCVGVKQTSNRQEIKSKFPWLTWLSS
uniref:histidine--tRNA ligase n=1 Tax=Ditylenchus dipsaci TaxID=166011 RepID=A0A915E1E9_9BILA